jgi:hypothetical protein
MNIYSLKADLIKYKLDYPNTRTKVILDINLKQALLDYPKFKELPINQKAAAIILGYIPKCDCGNPVKYAGRVKVGINSTPFGGWLEFCSTTCARSSSKIVERRKQTNIEKYGVDSWAKSAEAKEILTLPWSDEKKSEYNKNRIESSLIKYGVDHYSKTPEYLEKRATTILEKSNGKYTNCFQDIEKIKATNNTRYGTDYYNQTIMGKQILSNNNAMKNPEIALKSKLARRIKHFSSELYEILLTNDSEKFKAFIDDIANSNNYIHRHQIANHLSISYSYLNNLMRQYNMNNDYLTIGLTKSHKEQEVVDFILSLNVSIKRGDRSILSGKEIDILIESHKLGIEFDGIYYHSVYSGGKDKLYHVNKTNLAEEKGYQLLHIFENEWDDLIKREIWKSIIKSKLGIYDKKIFARKCHIKEISSKESREFFDKNHLSGFIGASNHLGLFYKDELVSAVSYGVSRFNKSEIELYRFASLLGIQVVGGLGKLLKRLPKENLISFADRRISGIDSVYKNFFTNKKTLLPSWWGFKSGTSELKHRLSYTKSNVIKILGDKYNNNLSCIDNMFNNGYDIIYDSGNYKFYN